MDSDNMEIVHEYTRETWWKNLGETVWHAWIKKRRLLIDLTGKPAELKGKPELSRREVWTDRSPEEIHGVGYRECRGLHDSIFWWGARMYCRLHNFCEFDIASAYPEKKDTPQTLNDEMESNTDDRFKRALARASLGQVADWQKIGLIAVLGAGVVFGAKLLGFW